MNYPYLRIWHEQTGSHQYYIENLIQEAIADNQPETIIYKDLTNEKWIDISQGKSNFALEVKKKGDEIIKKRKNK